MAHNCVNEERLSRLEADTRVNNNSINNLVDKLDALTGEVKWLIRLLFGTLIVVSGFFLSKYF